MELTRKQEEGLKIALQRHRNLEKFTVISGYAGTGKSTLVRFIINALDVDEDKVVYTAYTGKEVEVLSKKGNKNSIRRKPPVLTHTIHGFTDISSLALLVYCISAVSPKTLEQKCASEDAHLLNLFLIFMKKY